MKFLLACILLSACASGDTRERSNGESDRQFVRVGYLVTDTDEMYLFDDLSHSQSLPLKCVTIVMSSDLVGIDLAKLNKHKVEIKGKSVSWPYDASFLRFNGRTIRNVCGNGYFVVASKIEAR